MCSGAFLSNFLRWGEFSSSGWLCYCQVFSEGFEPPGLNSVVLSPYPQLTSLELQYVSPKLLMCRDLELAVPGTYDPNQQIIRIQSIAPSLQVITSKQRPRKLTLMGERLVGEKGQMVLRFDYFFPSVNSRLQVKMAFFKKARRIYG